MLADIYSADSSYTYQVGGYSGDAWTYNYTRTLEEIFSGGTEFDNSILISGNIDCDLFMSINNQRYEYMMVVKDSESSSPNYRKMIVDPAFEGYEQAKLLGSCLIQSPNWSTFSVYNLTQMKAVIGGEMKGSRFCLGNKANGFKNLILYPTGMLVEKPNPEKAGSTTIYSAINYINTTTLEDIQNKTLQSSGFDIKHAERGLTNTTNYTFESNHRPILTFVIQYNDEILLVNAAYLITKGDGGVISMYQNGIPVSHAFGKVLNDPTFENMNTDATKPQWVARPNLGDVPENDLGLYCEVYTSRSTWYLRQHMLYNGSIVRRLLTISGLFFLWDSEYAASGKLTTEFNENLCLGSRDEYGQIKQDGYNKGWSDIVKNDEYFDKLDYKDMPTVNPNPPKDDDDYPDDPWGKIEWGGAYLGAGNFTNLWYCTATDLENLRRWMNGLDIDHPLPEGFNPMNQVLGLMQFPIGLGGTLTEELTMRTQANVTVHSGVMINRGFGDDLYYNLGSIDIPLRMKERGVPFLDYGSNIELYVPFCGVFNLDPQTVLGADLSVEMWLSPVTGECNCIVSVGRGSNRGPVAFGSGNMAADIPVSANGYGLYAAAAKEASLKRSELMFGSLAQGGQIISTAVQNANSITMAEHIAGETIRGTWGTVGAAMGGVSTAIGLGVSLAQATHNIRALDIGMQHAKNASGTSVSGSFSGTSAWHYPFTAYVKITRPRYRIPSNYAHTQGIPLVKAKTLSSCNGFTMCVGTDLSSVSATEIEKEQIAAFLSNGVIV